MGHLPEPRPLVQDTMEVQDRQGRTVSGVRVWNTSVSVTTQDLDTRTLLIRVVGYVKEERHDVSTSLLLLNYSRAYCGPIPFRSWDTRVNIAAILKVHTDTHVHDQGRQWLCL
jgi:hypothetical protein